MSIQVEEQVDTELIAPSKRKKKRSLPAWLDRPYHIWREQFQQDKCCPKKMVKTELMSSSYYISFLNGALALYIFIGYEVFNLWNATTKSVASDLDRILFCFTTISTIGYGNIVPYDEKNKIICMLYCVAGIPLFFMTIAANSVVLADVCRILYKSIISNDEKFFFMNWHFSALLLALHCLLGSVIFSKWIDDLDVLDAFYFSFISVTTIGFGDFCPTPEGAFQYFIVITYLVTGVATMLTFFSSLQRGIMWIHYYGRKVSDSEEAEIWYGGQMMTVKDLVTLVAERFGSTPDKLREVLHDLDMILEVACQEAEDGDVFEEECLLVREGGFGGTPPPVARKKTVFLSSSSDGSDDHQATVHSLTNSNQSTIPKDTELAILALGAIQHHLRKPSVRTKAGHRTPPVNHKSISKPSSDSALGSKPKESVLELRKQAHRVHSDGRLLDENAI